MLACCFWTLTCVAQTQSNSVYVCTPCHLECDGLEFDHPGTCSRCGMRLILKTDLLRTREFSFVFNTLTYSGEIAYPGNRTPKATIVLVPGHGKTDFVNGTQYYELRQYFTQLGFATLVWDRAGSGKSEGIYNHNQTVQSSAEEALAAIQQFKQKDILGSTKVGLWGISRAGWICPLIIEKNPSIAFWISVSGTDQFDSYRYMLATNFKISGRSELQVEVLMSQWDHYILTLRNGGESYETCKQSTNDLFSDPFFISIGGKILSESEFYKAPAYYKTSGEVFDRKTGVQILVSNFDKILGKIRCPVLGLFGEMDSQVDWRKTNELYRQTIGTKGNANLTLSTFPNCNHNMMICETGGRFENIKKFNEEACKGYYDTMTAWLRSIGLWNDDG